MAAKTQLPVIEDRRPVQSNPPRRRPFLFLAVLAIILYALHSFRPSPSYVINFTTIKTCAGHSEVVPQLDDSDSVAAARSLVPLEAHIMSKCPDARDCMKSMILPAMMRVYDKVNFTLSYIGTPTENDGVDCMHGPGECMGNIIELCAQNLYSDPKIWLGFTMCLTKDYQHIPQRELIEDCALEHAIDFEKLNECAARDDGAFGMGMLRSSVQRSAEVCSTFK
ncbi:hypothetical protein F5Y15DRAFT_419029 [Xylariaceae sp. FL0016]|nr:hypothetical protein F5Y15DRAFT_419029 [Xylariaceae sp. FL0016]